MLGQTTLSNNAVNPTRVSADGNPQYKPGGITIDWSTVTAASGDQTLPDGSTIKDGQKYLRYGQILCRIGVAEVQTVTFTGGPTSGSVVLTLPAVGDEPAQTVTAAFGASAASVQTSFQALSRIGAGGATVGRTGAGSAGDPYIYTITFNKSLPNPPLLTQTNTFAGGTTPTATIALGTSSGTNVGYFGPYDPSATDGRATLARGECYILDETVLQYGAGTAMLSGATEHYGSAVEGGLLWRDRVLHSSAATHTLALGPTLAEVETAFPTARWALQG